MEEQRKFCTNCGNELNMNADVCLKCGKKVEGSSTNATKKGDKKKGLPVWAIILIVLGSLLVLVGVIGVVAFAVIDENEISDALHNEIIDYDGPSGTIGDTLKLPKFDVTLDKAIIYESLEGEYYTDQPAEGKKYLVFFLTVKNTSSTSEYFNSWYIDGYEDGIQVDTEYVFNNPEGMSVISGDIAAGKSKQGYVAFEVSKKFDSFEFIYEDYDDNVITFTVLDSDDSSL